MNNEHKKILNFISEYLEHNPDLRFGQALFNLDINTFIESNSESFILRDIHGDSDDFILKRINQRLEWFELQKKVNNAVSNIDDLNSMTVNERLYVTGLLDIFEKYKIENENYARYILKEIKVDQASIDKILRK